MQEETNKPEEVTFGEEKPNVYERALSKLRENGQNLSQLDQAVREIGIHAFKTLDLKDGDIIALQPDKNIPPERWVKVMEACHATKDVMGIKVNFLVIPPDFKMKILRPGA